jgi:hypothetical protein
MGKKKKTNKSKTKTRQKRNKTLKNNTKYFGYTMVIILKNKG